MKYSFIIFLSVLILFSESLLAQKKGELTNTEKMELTRIFIDAGKEKNLGNQQEAFELYQKCLTIDPKHDASFYELGQIFKAQNREADAEQMFRKASELDQKNDWYKMRLGEALDAQGKFGDSAPVWESLYDAHPRNLQYIDYYGSALLFSGKTKQALKFYDKVEADLGINEALSITKQKIYMRENKPEKAAAELQKLIKAFPEETDYYGRLADLYYKSGENEKALNTYEQAIAIDPSNPFLQLSLAEFYDREGQFEKSDEYLEKAFGNRDLDIDTKVTILLRLYRTAEKDLKIRNQALKLCKSLSETHPKNPKASAVYGDFLYLNKQWKEARTQYEVAVEQDPSKFIIWSQLLFIDSELSDSKKMIEHSEKAMEFFPTQPLPYLFNGLGNLQTKNYPESIESLETGIGMVVANPPMSAQMLASLGDAYHELGRNTSSDSAYDLSLRYDPDNIYVLNNYAYFLSLREDRLDDALKMSAKTIEAEPNNASYLDTYGWILFKAGNYKEARKYLQQSLNNGAEGSGEVLEHLGDTLFKLGKTTEAVDHWKRAKEAGGASENIDAKIKAEKIVE